MLTVLSFIACLGAEGPARCQPVEIAWEGSMRQCQLFGQMAAADWVREHAGYHLRGGYRCLSGRAA